MYLMATNMPPFSLSGYLDQILAARGSHAVPYQENSKWVIRDHLIEIQKVAWIAPANYPVAPSLNRVVTCFQVFPSLAIKLSDFHANDGRWVHAC